MPKKVLIIFFTFCSTFGYTQNLIPNPSFEDTISCPTGDNQINKAVGWVLTRTSPDYFNSCATIASNASVPENIFGYQYAATGNAYAGFWAKESTTLYKEHFGTQLISNLQIGMRYFVSLKVNLSPKNGNVTDYCAINKIGVLFSTINYGLFYPSPVNNYAQVYTDSIITDTLNWTTIKGSFVADSNYSFITIGNFFDDAQIDSIQLSGSYCHSYYFVDDICVSTDSLICYSTVGIQEPKRNNVVILFPNPFTNQINLTSKRNELSEVILFDITGRILLSQSFVNSTSINTEQLAKGIYLYNVRNNKRVMKYGKIVKE
jgi:hypothetical protein